jgi:hypothetical protein
MNVTTVIIENQNTRTSIGVTETVRKWKWKIRKHLRTGIDPEELTDPLELYGRWVEKTKFYRSKIKLSINLTVTGDTLFIGTVYVDAYNNQWLAITGNLMTASIRTTHKDAKKVKALYKEGTELILATISATHEL